MTLDAYLDEFAQLMRKVDPAEAQALVDAIEEAYKNDAFVFIIGNGGSGANASHFCEDLGKGTLSDFENQKRLKVMSLTDNTPYILAWANDTSYENVFVEQLKNFGHPGALLIAISGSGNSPNVIKAVEYANAHGMKTFGMSGYDGGKLRKIAQQDLHVPSYNMGALEAVHGVYMHYVLDVLRERFKGTAA
ncbi:MAG: SIS domain-containing protein [Candidatus Omnitrophota bacterium]